MIGETWKRTDEKRITPPKDGTPSIQPRHWERLLHVAAEANHLFPQAFFAQGIQLAYTMGRFAVEEGIPLSLFLKNNPDDKMIRDNLGPERIKGHAAHGFQTIPRGPIDLPTIWSNDKRAAINDLVILARHVASQRPDIAPLQSASDAPLLDAVQDDPVFQGLLQTASAALSLPEVTEISTVYKGKIGDFMQKYPPTDQNKPIPEDYTPKREALMTELEGHMIEVATLTKKQLIAYLQANHPEERRLIKKFTTAELTRIFDQDKDRWTKTIDPLRTVDVDY